MRVVVVGLWHLGTVTAACLAERGHHVVGIDRDPHTVAELNAGRPPIAEPGLTELVRSGLSNGALRFSNSFADAAEADIVWLTHDVPLGPDGTGDPTPVRADAAEAARFAAAATYFVSSQVPVGTCDALAELVSGPVACLPENLQLGRALERFRRPDLSVIGTDDAEVADLATRVLGIADPVVCDRRTAELIKHALNAYLATCITLANELGDVAERVGADAHRVATALRRDRRVGVAAPLVPGPPFMGGTLARDLRSLQNLGRGAEVPTPLCDAVLDGNRARIGRLVGMLGARIPLADARIALVGLAYTAGTDTMRVSPGAAMAAELRAAGATVTVWDPLVREISAEPGVRACASPAEAARDAHAVVVLRADLAAAVDALSLTGVRPGGVLLDVWNAVDPAIPTAHGLRHLVPGRAEPRGVTCAPH
ncbi:nucleotide sugar dehydrogenase [Nocardia takedensis]